MTSITKHNLENYFLELKKDYPKLKKVNFIKENYVEINLKPYSGIAYYYIDKIDFEILKERLKILLNKEDNIINDEKILIEKLRYKFESNSVRFDNNGGKNPYATIKFDDFRSEFETEFYKMNNSIEFESAYLEILSMKR
ncbi:MAG: hypothetical protein ACOVRN_12610 [Flavobacterium sp.]